MHVEDYAMEQLSEDLSMKHKLQEPTIEHLPKDYAMEHSIEEEPPLEYFPEDDPPMESLTIDGTFEPKSPAYGLFCKRPS